MIFFKIKYWLKLLLLKTAVTLLRPKKTPHSFNHKIGICSSISHDYVDMFIFTIHSFFYHTQVVLPIFLTIDSSDPKKITQADVRKLKKHFTVYIEYQSQKKMKNVLKSFHFFYKYRFSVTSSPSKYKFDALFLCPFSRYIFIDSDFIFFKKPTEIINFIQGKKSDIMYVSRERGAFKRFSFLRGGELSLRILMARYLGIEYTYFDPFFTSGILTIASRQLLSLPYYEKFFALSYHCKCAEDWLSEERATGFAIHTKKHAKLDPRHYVTATNWPQYLQLATTPEVIAVHYQDVTGLKSRYITDALLLCLKTIFFTKQV